MKWKILEKNLNYTSTDKRKLAWKKCVIKDRKNGKSFDLPFGKICKSLSKTKNNFQRTWLQGYLSLRSKIGYKLHRDLKISW